MSKRVAVALLAASFAFPANADFVPSRVESFMSWCNHYKQLMGLREETLRFVYYQHNSYCAWVHKNWLSSEVEVGISHPDNECIMWSPKKLALHEMCHLRMKHLEQEIASTISVADQHYEVRECMKWYEERDSSE